MQSGVCKAVQYLKSGKKIVDLSHGGSGLTGVVDFEHIKGLIASYTGHELQGSAHVALEQLSDGPRYRCSEVSDAHIKVPFTHAVVEKGRGIIELDSDRGLLSITDLEVELTKGVFRSPQVTIATDDAGALSFIHIPCTAHALFISWDKDVSGSLSGAGVATYKEGVWNLGGSLLFLITAWSVATCFQQTFTMSWEMYSSLLRCTMLLLIYM